MISKKKKEIMVKTELSFDELLKLAIKTPLNTPKKKKPKPKGK